MRVPVGEYVANRTQKRSWVRHRNLVSRVASLAFDHEHYDLYLRYQSTRHAGGGMDNDSREQYSQFLLQSKVNTRLVEFRADVPSLLIQILSPKSTGNSGRAVDFGGRSSVKMRQSGGVCIAIMLAVRPSYVPISKIDFGSAIRHRRARYRTSR